MIPKIIHYCWFGGKPLPEDAKKFIKGWSEKCPDYVIKEWNEENFDFSENQYISDAYKEKKWAFVTDYVRLYALVNEGGIYMDTDVELIKSLDDLLSKRAFSGFQTVSSIPTGIMASEKGFQLFKELLDEYTYRSFYNSDGTLNLTTNVVYITNACLKRGLKLNNKYQNIDGFELYPVDYFCAKSWESGHLEVTKNTYSIHHFAGSWESGKRKVKADRRRHFLGKYGKNLGKIFYYATTWPLHLSILYEDYKCRRKQ